MLGNADEGFFFFEGVCLQITCWGGLRSFFLSATLPWLQCQAVSSQDTASSERCSYYQGRCVAIGAAELFFFHLPWYMPLCR